MNLAPCSIATVWQVKNVQCRDWPKLLLQINKFDYNIIPNKQYVLYYLLESKTKQII